MRCLYSCCEKLCRRVNDGCHAPVLSIARCASAALCSVDGLVGLVRSLDSSRSDVSMCIGLGGGWCGAEVEEGAAVLDASLVVVDILWWFCDGVVVVL